MQEGSRLRAEISASFVARARCSACVVLTRIAFSILRLLNDRKLEMLKERWWQQVRVDDIDAFCWCSRVELVTSAAHDDQVAQLVNDNLESQEVGMRQQR